MDPAFFIVCDYKPQNLLIFMRIAILFRRVRKSPAMYKRIHGNFRVCETFSVK